MNDQPFLDWQFFLCAFAVFGMAVGSICYWIGRGHGFACGYEAGCADEVTRLKPKIIQAKRDAGTIARTLCLAELNRGARQLTK